MRAGQEDGTSNQLGREWSEMAAHVPFGADVPDVAGVRAVAVLVGVAEEVVVVVTTRGQMEDVLVAPGKAVPDSFGHPAVFGPNDPVAD
jgi:hypothetical protein